MIHGTLQVSGIEKIQERIDYLKKLQKMTSDKGFQAFIQEKCLETIKKVAEQRFATSTNTNKDLEAEYNRNHKIRDITDKGFVIYNDYWVEKPATKFSASYPFSVALAFEYGTGLVGANHSANTPSWYAYNVNDNRVTIDGEEILGWWLDVTLNGNNPTFGQSKSGKAVITRGYEGMEIYRFSAIEIQKNFSSWVREYFKK